ncbi:MAG: hypothetical protein K1X44_01710 [Alphaproteobacteria bacterium]|nr:hypothetical protein [Alphaproteobacteria bacterium]
MPIVETKTNNLISLEISTDAYDRATVEQLNSLMAAFNDNAIAFSQVVNSSQKTDTISVLLTASSAFYT